METLGQRIRRLREEQNISQRELAHRLGWAESRLSNYELDKRVPKLKQIKEISQGIGCTFEDLVSDTQIDNGKVIARSSNAVPLISWVRAGHWEAVEDPYPPGEAGEWITPHTSYPGSHAFGLRIEGDSMTAPTGISFPDGCIIIVDPERAPMAGDYVVAKDVSTQKATFKRLTTDGNRWYLKPLNPAYPAIEIDDPAVRVIGVAVEWQMGGKL